MKMNIDVKVLLNGINRVGKFKSKIKENPVLQYILLNVTETALTFVASDNDVYYKHVEPVTEGVQEAGSFLIPDKLEEILRKVSGVVDLTLEGNALKFVGANTNATIPVTVISDFVKEPTGEAGPGIQFSKELLLDIVNQCGYAASPDNTRPVLKSINMSGKDGEFKVVSTDSFRLVQKVRKQPFEISSLNIPARIFKTVLESLDDETEFAMASYGNHLLLKAENQEIFIRLLSGIYPDTEKLSQIGEGYIKVKVNSKDLIDALQMVMLFSDSKKSKTVVFESLENQIRIYTKGELGEIERFVQAETPGFTPTALNPTYVIEAVNAHKKISTELLFKNGVSTAPMFVMCEDASLTQLILPVRIAELSK